MSSPGYAINVHFAAQRTKYHYLPSPKIERTRYSAVLPPLRRGNQVHSQEGQFQKGNPGDRLGSQPLF